MRKTLKIEDELNSLNRRMERVEKKLDLLDSDREIFETIQGRLTQLEEQWKLTRRHDNEVTKDIKEEIGLMGDKVTAGVETKVEELQSLVKRRKKGKKGKKKTIIEKIKRIFRRR